MTMKQPWVLDWNEAAAAGAAVVGGKGWNLGRLDRYGFPVPIGGVVTSTAYEKFMADPTLKQLQGKLHTITAEDAMSPENVRQLEAMQSAIYDTPMPEDVVAQVHDFLVRNGLENVPLAVRSSATAEDSAAASFAGIHASCLAQVGIDAVTDSIRSCYASLWTPRAVAYRRRLGFSDADVLCAVVICRMVGAGDDPTREPTAAGVAFSCDPRTGRFDVVTIGAVPGLGTAVVDGSTNPEELTVEVGLNTRVVERSGQNKAVITDEQAIRLSHIVQRVQWALGDGQDPQDIEWAFDGSTFWLVQARPVTHTPRYTFDGAKHLPVVWSNANLKDALPGVLSPLAWSMSMSVIRHNLFAPHQAAGYDIPPGLEAVRRFSGRAYFDLTSLFWAFYDGVGLTASEFNRSMGGHQPEIPVAEPDPMKGPQARRLNRARMKLLRAIFRVDKILPARIQDCFDIVQRERGVDLTRESMDDLRTRLDRYVERSLEFGPLSMLANTSAGLWHDMLEKVLAKIAPDDAARLASHLVAGAGNVVSAEHGYRLLDLAKAADADPAAKELLEAEPLDASKWKELPKTSPFRQEIEQFLADFGHRAVYEVDIANPRWIDDPTYILQQVRHILAAGLSNEFREAGRERRRLAEQTVTRRTVFLRPVIRWLARRARHGFAMREGSKSALVAHLEPCRNIFLEVGRRMNAAGTLNDPHDVFDLSWIDVDAFMRSWWDGKGAQALVSDRKAQRGVWLAEEPPDVLIMNDDGTTQTENVGLSSLSSNLQGIHPEPSGATLQGTGVSAGNATGRVRILRHPNEGEKLTPGDILVAPSTDPGWTPLFMRAAAVVMEVGGYHSHGAVVAREFGIPAVANIPHLLNMLQDGEVVTVHGEAGTITRTITMWSID